MSISIKRLLTAAVCAGALIFSASCQDGGQASKQTVQSIPKNLSDAVKWQEVTPGSAEYHFLVGGFEAMSAIEFILQTRYNNYSGELPLLPGGSLNFMPNPDAKFDPAFVEIALTGALEHLALAEASLARATEKDFAINVNIGELWLDINGNGTRDEGEAILNAMQDLPLFSDANMQDMSVRFDTADASWLAAYVHMVSGMAELILSVDPTPAIKTVTDGRTLLAKKARIEQTPYMSEDEIVDTWSIVFIALRGQPDKTRTRAALSHFRAMIDHNKTFWELVMAETDNEDEWLPNPSQSSAFGVDVSMEIALGWQDVLSEISDVLEGRTLLPHWRVDENAKGNVGINFAKLLQNPETFDLVLMLQGAAVAPFIEEGKLVDMRALRSFSSLTGGRGGLFAFWLN